MPDLDTLRLVLRTTVSFTTSRFLCCREALTQPESSAGQELVSILKRAESPSSKKRSAKLKFNPTVNVKEIEARQPRSESSASNPDY